MANKIEWQLYSTVRGVGLISNILTKKLQKLAAIETNPFIIRDKMFEVMTKYRKWGARDTEPECVVCEEIEKLKGLPVNSLGRWSTELYC